jgi:hypothetical protein
MTKLKIEQHELVNPYFIKYFVEKNITMGANNGVRHDTVSAGRRHTNGYELCPSSSRFIFILILVGVSSKVCRRSEDS